MLFSDSYFTIEQPVETVYKIKGSKFLAFAFYVETETQIKEQLHALKKEHPSANHHCYAWRLGPDKAAFRANDDGEPANTAGKPILSQLQSKDLTNCLVVVIRYFGGTLLGVGGLISAYKTAAAEVLAKARIIEKHILVEYRVEFVYNDISQVMRTLKENEAKIISTEYETANNIIFTVKKIRSEQLEQKFKELYQTKLTFIKTL